MTATLEAPGRAAGPSEPRDNDTGDDTTDGTAPPPRPVPAALAAWHDPHPWHARLSLLMILVFAGFTRFWALGWPPGRNVIPKNGTDFDEVYYTVEAQEWLRYGYEDNRGYMFIVHPPLGKILIGMGEWFVGALDGQHGSDAYLSNTFGWRLAPALFGIGAIVVVLRTTRRMLRSNLFGLIAGLLMCMEGMSLVLARTGILDIFLQFFVIAGFGALVVDRDKMRARLGTMVSAGVDLSGSVPTLGPRPWRLIGGLMLGLACGVKWTALSFFVLFVVLSIVWDRAAFKSAGAKRPSRAMWRRSALPALGSLIAAPIGAYLLTYLGWFTGENSWNRHWADTHSASAKLDIFGVHIPFDWAWLPGPIRSLGSYTLQAYRFHESLDSGHTYGSKPWSWLVLGRPVDFYYNGSETTCGSSACSREVLLIGTPLMWWAFVPMLLWLAWHWFTTRDWRAAAVLVAFAAGWVVWFQDLKRTMFLFYMAPLVPFLIIGLTLALGMLLGPALPERRRGQSRAHSGEQNRGTVTGTTYLRALRRRQWGIAGVAGYLALVVVDFAWMWPLFTGGLLTYGTWHAHMWLPSWV